MKLDSDEATAALEQVRRILRADGADLVLVDANPKTARIRVRLDLEGVTCAECVLPPDALRDTIEQSLRTRIREEFELVIDDPRREPFV
jgi:Fe-S cluster biogenesis protein NfuA